MREKTHKPPKKKPKRFPAKPGLFFAVVFPIDARSLCGASASGGCQPTVKASTTRPVVDERRSVVVVVAIPFAFESIFVSRSHGVPDTHNSHERTAGWLVGWLVCLLCRVVLWLIGLLVVF